MKKYVGMILAAVLLTGCSARETFETIADDLVEPAAAVLRQVVLSLPLEAAVPVSETENGKLYLCDGYEIALQTLPSGDLNATVRSISGFSREDLTILEHTAGDYTRYDMVWTSAGEEGDRIGKAAVLDDGNYHYVLSILADSQRVREYEGVWQEMLDSYALLPY